MKTLTDAHPPAVRCISGIVAICFVIAQYGCATRPPSMDLHWQLRNQVTALIPAQLQTKLILEPYASSRPAGALKGAGQGAVVMLDAMASTSSHCEGWPCAFILVTILAITVTAAGVGAVVGAIQATPAEKTGHMVGAVDQLTRKLVTHLDLASRVSAHAGMVDGVTVELIESEDLVWMENAERWQTLRNRGFANALEVGVTKIEFVGGTGDDPELALHMTACARLIDLTTGAESYRELFHYVEPHQRFSQWAADQGAIMRHAVEQGLVRLSTDIAHRLFEQATLPIPSGFWALPWSDEFGCCWLCPTAPRHELSHKPWKGTIEIKYLPVSSRQPELAWESFPRPGQEAGLREAFGSRQAEVHYDLRIWESRGERPGDLVYERRGLTEPRHLVEDRLLSGHRYFWSFRACFTTGKGTLCTPWAFSSVPAADSCEIPSIPPANYFRFKVP